MYKLNTKETSITIPDLLHCSSPRTFWLSWEQDEIRLGQGGIRNRHTLLEWHDTEHGAFTASVSKALVSTGNEYKGYWTIPMSAGTCKQGL